MNNKKIIGLIGQTQSTCSFIQEQIINFLGNYVDVKIWCMDLVKMPPRLFFDMVDVFVISNNSVYSVTKKLFPDDVKVIIARRTVNIDNIHKILDLMPGERVLVVTTTEETANNTISILKGLGIEYIKFVPYWPKCGNLVLNDIKIAITPGLTYLVPEKIERVIDIGGKGIDISTFAEILQILDIQDNILDNISNYYLNAILRNNIQIRNTALKNEKLVQSMKLILDNVVEGIVAIDANDIIKFYNPPAEEIFQKLGKSMIDSEIRGFIPSFNRQSFLQDTEEISNHIVVINSYHYILKAYPLDGPLIGIADMVLALLPAEKLQELDKRVRSALKHKGNFAKYTFADLCGESIVINKTVALAKKFAATDLTVLIEGESGTGKELLAQSIHNYSKRNKGPFVAINFAGIPENLAESILFGYEEGAFTGARKGGKTGLFEEAHMGTIFLDEIGSASPDIQNRLLRVLEECEIRRVGGSNIIPVNFRVIAASNIKLNSMVQQGLFRMDLYYRVCAVPINIPPLRERREDLFLLIDYLSNKMYSHKLTLSYNLQNFFLDYDWPGNIRELHNVVRYLCNVVGDKKNADIIDLPTYIFEKTQNSNLFSDKQKDKQISSELIEILRIPDKSNVVESILTMLQEARVFGRSVGRKTLQKRLAEKEIILSEYNMKYWLQVLAELGYIESGVTRQGAKITEIGQEALQVIKREAWRFCGN